MGVVFFHVFHPSCRSKCRLVEVFARLLKKMWMGGCSSCAPVETRSVLCSILPQFNNYCQQDSHELLLFLLNMLHDDLKKVTSKQNKTKQKLLCKPAQLLTKCLLKDDEAAGALVVTTAKTETSL